MLQTVSYQQLNTIPTADTLDGQKLLSWRSRLKRHAKCGSLLRSVIGSLDRGGGGR